jgi:hypothetical protein
MRVLKFVKSIMSAIMLMAFAGCSTTSNTSPTASQTQGQKQRVDENSLSRADLLIKAKKYREAEILLTREAQKDPNDFSIQRRLFTVHTAQAKENFAKVEYINAGEYLKAAEADLARIKLIGFNPKLRVPNDFQNVIKNQEEELTSLKKKLTHAVDASCDDQLSDAVLFAKDAESQLVEIDRDLIVNGLVKIRKCNEYGNLLSVDARGRSNNLARKLLNFVPENERESILRAAGF